jgi:hypothetical protein
VVDKGVLKTFLLDRAPLKAGTAARSNGHGRAEPGYAPVSRQSNLVVESSKSVSDEQADEYAARRGQETGKAFGLFFDNIEGGFTNTQRGSANAFNVLPNVVYRIYTDGRAPELVRGVDLIGTPLSAFAKIAATGDKTDVFNGVCGAESGGVPVSASSPALLVSEVEVQKKAQSQETAPILPAPGAGEKVMRTRGSVRNGRGRGFRRASLPPWRLRRVSPRQSGGNAQRAQSAQESPLILAMQDEMKRSMSELRMKDAPAPYYIAYEVQDRTVTDVSGRLGALIENLPRRMRVLRVEVRVGDYAFDSSRFISQGFGGGGGLNGETALVALDDDYDAIRRDIWITTDEAYKRAVNTFARKRAAFQNRSAADPLPDFSKEAPVELQLPAKAAGYRPRPRGSSTGTVGGARRKPADRIVRNFHLRDSRHAVFPEQRRVQDHRPHSGGVAHHVRRSTGARRHAGARNVHHGGNGRCRISRPPPSLSRARGRSPAASLPARNAPVGEEFTGPVLLEGAGAPQFIAETLLPLVAARRSPDSDSPRMAQGFAPATPFLSRTGTAESWRIRFPASDTPSLTQFNGKPVAGAYVVDDEGVRAKDVTLGGQGPARDAADQPHATEKFPAVERARPCQRRVGRRVSARKRAGHTRGRAQIEVHRAAQGAGKNVRVHRARRASHGWSVGCRPGHRPGGQGHPGRQGRAGARTAVRHRSAHRIPRCLRSVSGTGPIQLSRRPHLRSVGDIAEPDLRRVGDSAHSGHLAETTDSTVTVKVESKKLKLESESRK